MSDEFTTICNMHPGLNPFTPGSGLRPPSLVGRDAEIAAFDLLVARSLGRRNGASIILHGYRGVGKTVLLNAMRDQADRAGWLCIDVEAQTSDAGPVAIRQRIARKLHAAAEQFKNGKTYSDAVRRALGTLTGFSISLGVVSIETAREPASGRASSGVLEVDLEELVEDFADALRESGSAVGIFIDEMQDVDDELLSALLTVQNRAGQRGIPFYVIGAGLPTLPARLASARSYAERLFDYRHIGAVSVEAAEAAIRQPLLRNQTIIEDDALAVITGAAKGYPYFLQRFGYELWNVAEGQRINADVAARAVQNAYLHLDQGYFRSSWDRADEAERSVLKSMAAESEVEEYAIERLAANSSLSSSEFSAVREALTQKGIIFNVGPGRVAFTTPGMTGHVRRRMADQM